MAEHGSRVNENHPSWATFQPIAVGRPVVVLHDGETYPGRGVIDFVEERGQETYCGVRMVDLAHRGSRPAQVCQVIKAKQLTVLPRGVTLDYDSGETWPDWSKIPFLPPGVGLEHEAHGPRDAK